MRDLIIGITFVYVCGMILSGIPEGTYFGGTGVATIWQVITSFKVIDFTSPLAIVSGVVLGLYNILVGIWEIFSWKFSFFVDEYAIFRWMFFAITTGLIVTFLINLRGVSSD